MIERDVSSCMRSYHTTTPCTQGRIEKALTLVESRQDNISALQHEGEQACHPSRWPSHHRLTVAALLAWEYKAIVTPWWLAS